MTSTQTEPARLTPGDGEVEELDVLVVGAGFAGLYQLDRLRTLGLSVKIYEAGSGLGGIWYWNCYPGARVDTHGPLYQFSSEKLWKGWDYEELYPAYNEVRAYFEHVDERLDLRRDIRFDTKVTGAEFDEERRQWVVSTDGGPTARARFILLCTGIGAKPILPEIPGLDDFGGEWHHTALWPQDGLDLAGKRIGVIGTGATGVQVIQESAKVASQLTVFQRTPNLALPMRQQKLDDEAKAALRVGMNEQYARRAETFGGFEYDFTGPLSTEYSREELVDLYQGLWDRGGFRLWLGTFFDVLEDEEANRIVYDLWRDNVRKRIKDPELAEKLAPTEPPHPFGVKRPSLEQNYYDLFNQDNVRLVDVKEHPIQRITKKGVLTADGEEHELDLLVLATGFDAVTGGLTAIDIKGTAGETLGQKWQRGVNSYLGSATHDFPNLMFVYGPQSPSGFANGPSAAELQGEEIFKMIEYMNANGHTRFEATDEADKSWRAHVDEIADRTLFTRANSWYMGANVPGKVRQLLNYPGGLPQYLEKWAETKEAGYTGFEIS
ncbi:MAG TPA: NAD(P)/FAD-dependent oxidoreductase [Pseudonocardia sp.]